MEVDKLTPAPWKGTQGMVLGPDGFCIHDDAGLNEDDAKFIALSRNAFDVMMRRKWGVWSTGERWFLRTDIARFPEDFCDWMLGERWICHYTALVEADRWYRENVEKSS